MNVMTADELSQFQLIIENAHREGWINAGAELVAEQSESAVRVTAREGRNHVERTYIRDARWPFRLLRDLAWGVYRSWGAPLESKSGA